ncbi:hypothetical protein [Sulfurovum sp.]|uniref:hypothetical protein n=1 Tax=Sulfurovum sp. TaxID=1969726 RepID=UPI0035639C1A
MKKMFRVNRLMRNIRGVTAINIIKETSKTVTAENGQRYKKESDSAVFLESEKEALEIAVHDLIIRKKKLLVAYEKAIEDIDNCLLALTKRLDT